MTIIAACKKNGVVAIGCDEMGSNYSIAIFPGRGSKLVARQNWIAGISWSYRVRDIIKESAALDFGIKSIAEMRLWRDHLKNLLCENAGAKREAPANNELISHPFGIIVAANGRIFYLACDYQLHEINDYAATGSGQDCALGALHAIRTTHTPKEAVSAALRAACRHNCYCGGRICVRESRA